MDRYAFFKWVLLAALIAFSLVLVTPPFDRTDAQGNVVRPGKVRLGLDLKGGTSFTVQIDTEELARTVAAESPTLTPEQVAERVKEIVSDSQGRTLEILRNRVDKLGIAEPIIYPGKENRIIIQLPGIDEKKRAEAETSIRSAAFLEFRMVHEENAALTDKLFEKNLSPEGYRIADVGAAKYYRRDPRALPDSAMDAAYRERLSRFNVPDAGYEFMLEKVEVEHQTLYRPYFVRKRRELSGEYLKSAAVDYSGMGQPVVKLHFDARGARKFASVTADYAPGGARNPNPNQYRQLAIVLDGTLYSAPRINEPIYGGRAEISGSFSVAEAQLLANILTAGSLPAPITIVERRVVDPSLGSDSVRSGVSAGIYGCIAVVVLMALYYLLPGLIADLALVLNVILLPLGMLVVAGFLGIFSGGGAGSGAKLALPVLTLPGIAGIALTIGMAVDANVLIFERIREELRVGKGFLAAIQAGYERAFTAIFDSNITTIITAVILFILGSGPVRGYAVTLTAGLLVSLFTAVVVTRMCFNAIALKTQQTSLLKMVSLFPPTRIDFMSKWKTAIAISIVVIVASWGVMLARGLKAPASVLGVDFVGGTAVTLGLDVAHKPEVDALRKALNEGGVKDATIQYQTADDGVHQNLLVKTAAGGSGIGQILAERFPDAQFKVLQQDDVGPQVGSELKRKAAWAMFWSLMAMIAYISWRFEFGFALGAVVALFHDVLVTAGLAHVFGFQINMTVVAALMTIVGYSVNDTIVIFDRIREDLRLVRNKTFLEICNQSLNETLSRTLLTSFLTLVSVASLLVFGGGAIKDFSAAMFIGLLAGTYSTVYIATPIVLIWYRFKTPDLGSKLPK